MFAGPLVLEHLPDRLEELGDAVMHADPIVEEQPQIELLLRPKRRR